MPGAAMRQRGGASHEVLGDHHGNYCDCQHDFVGDNQNGARRRAAAGTCRDDRNHLHRAVVEMTPGAQHNAGPIARGCRLLFSPSALPTDPAWDFPRSKLSRFFGAAAKGSDPAVRLFDGILFTLITWGYAHD